MNMEQLNREEQYLVLENRNIVYKVIKKFGVTQNSPDYEDLVSIGILGLIKASMSYKEGKATFSTYAFSCIHNEIANFYKKAQKYANDIYIEYFEDKQEEDFSEKMMLRESCIRIINFILNHLNGKKRLAYLYNISGMSQIDIAKKLNLNHKYVSCLIIEVRNKLKEMASDDFNVNYSGGYIMDIKNNKYIVSFAVKRFNEIFSNFVTKFPHENEKIPDFNVKKQGDNVIIEIPAEPESIYFLAEIIKEIDNFSISFIQGNAQKKDNSEKKKTHKAQKEQREQIKEYMLSLESFTTKDLRNRFPQSSSVLINNIINGAKIKGLVTPVGKGEYIVNK